MSETASVGPRPQHVLMTRYNLAVPGGNKNLDEMWLRNRLTLFKRYCVPSVRAQDDQDFLWLVLLDERTPPTALDAVSESLPGNARIVRLQDPLDDTPMEPVMRAVGLDVNAPLLTSRLDSDDAIGRLYTRAMREAADHHRGSQRMAFNFPIGFQLCAGRIYGLPDLNNPFMSLLEPFAGLRTVLGASHREMTATARVRQLGVRPQWLQVVHEDNLDNSVRGVRVRRRALNRDFRFLLAENPEHSEPPLEVARDAARTAGRLVRAGARKLVQRTARS